MNGSWEFHGKLDGFAIFDGAEFELSHYLSP